MTEQHLEDLYRGFHDDETFARESLTVLGKDGQLRPMEFGPAQRKLAKVIQKLREQRKPVRIIVLKARQVWISTYVAARFWRDTVHRPGQHTLVLAQDETTADNVYRYYQRFDTHYQPFGGVIDKPRRINDSTQSLEYDNESWVHFHTAKTTSIGRSFTLRRIHFSEFAFYGDNARALLAATMSAMPDDADTEAIIESTANGIGNEYHLMCQRAISGESEWTFFFFAWWEHPEYVRSIDSEPAEFERTLTSDERTLMQAYRLTLGQLAWRRWKISTDLGGDESLFKQEFPSCPEEAFLSSGRPRFDLKAVERMPIIRDAMEGGLEEEEVAGRKRLFFLPRERGELVIYRRPQEHREYMIGADSAEGIDVNAIGGKSKGTPNPDYAVAQVHDRDTGEQVARLRARLTPCEFGRQLRLLGIYYHWAQMVIEANGPGLATIQALVTGTEGRTGYPSSLLYHRIQTPDQDPAVRSDLIGFKMTPVTRPKLISLVDEAIRDMALLIHDPVTLSELRTFVIKPTGKPEAQYGTHDDTVIGEGLVLIGMKQMPRKPKEKIGPKSHSAVNNYLKRSDHSGERGTRLRLL